LGPCSYDFFDDGLAQVSYYEDDLEDLDYLDDLLFAGGAAAGAGPGAC
jgi:hypothetical protein